MKKKLLSVLLSTAMVAALLVGCTSEEPAEGGVAPEGGEASTEGEAVVEDLSSKKKFGE